MQIKTEALSEGFTLPFEGEKHTGTIILLPYRRDTWRKNARPAIKCYLKLVKIISKFEHVYLGVDEHLNYLLPKLKRLKNVTILRVDYNDAWARDNTLIFIRKGKVIRAVDFDFNAWGGAVDGLYSDYSLDQELGSKLIAEFNYDYYRHNFILEGGSIHTDGEGTLLTTEACLLSKGRNPKYSKSEIEVVLKKSLGIKKVIWLPHGIYGDETNEHIDNMACFIRPGVVLLAVTDDENDPQYAYSQAAYDILKEEKDALGRSIEVVTIPVPTDLVLTEEEAKTIEVNPTSKPRLAGERLAASYVNFYQSQKFVIVPKFNHPLDQQAFNIIKGLYPGKEVYQLRSKEILLGGGNIHCVTMQIPKGEDL